MILFHLKFLDTVAGEVVSTHNPPLTSMLSLISKMKAQVMQLMVDFSLTPVHEWVGILFQAESSLYCKDFYLLGALENTEGEMGRIKDSMGG